MKTQKWDLLKFDAVKNYVNLYSSLILVQTFYIVSYSRMVSIYDLIRNQWTTILDFGSEVRAVLNCENFYYRISFVVVCEDGRVFYVSSNPNGATE